MSCIYPRATRYIIPLIFGATLAACSNINDAASTASAATVTGQSELTLEAIFTDEAYEAKKPGQLRWLSDKRGYTVLETPADYVAGDTGVDADAKDKEPEPKDIVFYDPASGERQVLVSAKSLTPPGADKPLEVDDYH
ncbi:MAG: S9 family peptidase, partial [Congregibacter sp.]|nr:S9 family peptidase [Congregibacter sp.]